MKILSFILGLLMCGNAFAAQFGNATLQVETGADQAGYFQGSKFTAPAGIGQITKVYVACNYSWREGQKIRVAMYTDNAGSPETLIANTDSGEMTVTRSTAPTSDLSTWTSADIASGFIPVEGTAYWTCVNCDNTDVFLYYDSDGGVSCWAANDYANFPNATAPSTSIGTVLFSVCYEYTTASGTTQIYGGDE